MIRVMIVDDHEIVRRGLRLTIQPEADLELVGEASSGEEALKKAAEFKPDVVLLDLQMPGMGGIEAAAELHHTLPDTAVLILTNYGEDDQVYAALQSQVAGYLLKDISGDDLLAAIRGAAKGNPQLYPSIARRLMNKISPPVDPLAVLTERERDVLRLLARGLSNKEIGAELHLSEATIKGYVSAVLGKLGVEDRTQAALLAVRYGLVKPGDLPEAPQL